MLWQPSLPAEAIRNKVALVYVVLLKLDYPGAWPTGWKDLGEPVWRPRTRAHSSQPSQVGEVSGQTGSHGQPRSRQTAMGSHGQLE